MLANYQILNFANVLFELLGSCIHVFFRPGQQPGEVSAAAEDPVQEVPGVLCPQPEGAQERLR